MLTWFIGGLFHLIILSYQDIRNKKIVDDRHNWFMGGMTLMLLANLHHSIKYLLAITISGLLFFYYFKKFKIMGEADQKTILWTYIGFGYFGIGSLIPYLLLLLTIYLFQTGLNFILCKFAFKRKIQSFPAYPMFLVSFILTYWFFV